MYFYCYCCIIVFFAFSSFLQRLSIIFVYAYITLCVLLLWAHVGRIIVLL